MRRRGENRRPPKRRHTTRPKARKPPTASVSVDFSREQVDLLKRERDEALEQQTATEFTAAGGLMSYSGDLAEAYRAAGVQIGHIIKLVIL